VTNVATLNQEHIASLLHGLFVLPIELIRNEGLPIEHKSIVLNMSIEGIGNPRLLINDSRRPNVAIHQPPVRHLFSDAYRRHESDVVILKSAYLPESTGIGCAQARNSIGIQSISSISPAALRLG
jgi:hypothetical protein